MLERNESLSGNFPTMPKQERAQHKRTILFESGQALFIEKGYEHTTAKEIASHAGVAIGTFYRYFSDKRQLLMALIENRLNQMLPPDISWTDGDPVKLLADNLEAHYSKMLSSGFHRILPEMVVKDHELAEILLEAKRKMVEKLCLHLKELKEKGYTWGDLDLETISWSILNLLEHLPEKECTGNHIDYYETAKLICRVVFPPEIIIKLH